MDVISVLYATTTSMSCISLPLSSNTRGKCPSGASKVLTALHFTSLTGQLCVVHEMLAGIASQSRHSLTMTMTATRSTRDISPRTKGQQLDEMGAYRRRFSRKSRTVNMQDAETWKSTLRQVAQTSCRRTACLRWAQSTAALSAQMVCLKKKLLPSEYEAMLFNCVV